MSRSNFFAKLGRGVGRVVDPLGLHSAARDMFRGGENPADSAREHLEPVEGYGREAHQPFIDQGSEAYRRLFPIYERNLTDPQAAYDEDVAGYEPSQRYRTLHDEMQQSARNAAIGGGFFGTPYDERRRADLTRELMGADLGTFLEDINSRRNTGMEGFETAIGRGHQSAGQMADFLGTNAGNKANLESFGTSEQNRNKTAFMNALMKAVAAGFGGYMGGGQNDVPEQLNPQERTNLRNIQTRPPMQSRTFNVNLGANRYNGGR